ncbi:aroma-sacti cluster domain-containing protein [Nonomuraea sp. NPDC050536]|uniref:aroma-sacti cluster domain-containing protein n=1 Tax=Nonomuraea sp. NPDC050536 TaxID=3364366 RepID=UPI0037CA5E4A
MADLSRLEELGFELHLANDEQLAVMESLTDEEIALLADIKQRLEEAGDDLEGHMDGGGLCW